MISSFKLTAFALLAISLTSQAQHDPSTVRQRTTIAFQLPETDLITEGLAYDSQNRTFYISSVHQRKILSHKLPSKTQAFSHTSDSLWGVFGMKVDPVRRRLWVCSSALPQVKGISAADDGKAALVAYDLVTKKRIHAYPVPADGKPHLLGDLVPARNGDVYSTDSQTPCIYRLATGDTQLKPFLKDSLFYSLQGLALSENEQTLYIADYRYGPMAIDLLTRKVVRLQSKEPIDLSGIDGLYFYQNSLIAIQNRVKPYRVTRLYLNTSGSQIDHVQPLVLNNPYLTEPTLGVVVNDRFYFIANSQWEAFDTTGKPIPNHPAEKPTVLVVNLH